MGGVRHTALVLAACALAGAATGCGSDQTTTNDVERQVEQQFKGDPQFVECDAQEQEGRFTCRVETSSDRYKFVAICSPGGPCAVRQTGAEFK